jgi:hypothetical protein
MKKNILTLMLVLFTSILFAQASNQKISTLVSKQIEVLKASTLNLSDIQISRITQVLLGEEEIRARVSKAFEGNKSILEGKLMECKANLINNVKGGMTSQQAEKFDLLKIGDKLL